jgi:hypothetical protein
MQCISFLEYWFESGYYNGFITKTKLLNFTGQYLELIYKRVAKSKYVAQSESLYSCSKILCKMQEDVAECCKCLQVLFNKENLKVQLEQLGINQKQLNAQKISEGRIYSSR